MARWAFLALCAALACSAAAQIELQAAEEGSDSPVFHTETYAIVHNGKVVGMMQHVHAEAVFGRRGGPSDDRPPSPLALRLADLFNSQADSLASLRDRLVATRCPMARQMALARLQMAAAAAGVSEPANGAQLLRRPSRDVFEPGFAGMAEPGVMDAQATEEVPPHRPMMLGGEGHGILMHHPGRDGPLLPRQHHQHRKREDNLFGLTPDARQAPRDHPEDLMDFATAQQDLLGAKEEAAEVDEEARAVASALQEELLHDEEAGPAQQQAGGASGAGFLMPRRPTGEASEAQAQAWGAAGADQELPGMPLLMPRLALDDAALAKPFEGSAEPAPMGQEEEAPEAPAVLAMVWHVLAGLAQPRPLPDIRGGAHGPHGRPLHPLPAVHHNPAHMMPHHPMHHTWPVMTGSGEVLTQAPDGRWVDLRNMAGPAPGFGPEVSWRLHNDDGTLNLGMVTFVVLATACAGVWGALVAQYALYRSACVRHSRSAASFITRVDGDKAAALQPLLHEGPVKPADVAGTVECASDHVAGGRSVAVLAYEPLPSSDK